MPFRILVNDKDEARDWYVRVLGYEIREEWGTAFAILARGDVELWLSGPQTSAARAMLDGSRPVPGGWNRVVHVVKDFERVVAELRALEVTFRNDPIAGPGGSQVLIEDPSGNPIEIFCPFD